MILSTDSTANLPVELYKELDIKMIPMQILLENKIYDDLSKDLPVEQFYKKMSEGATPTTAQINEYAAKEYLENLLKLGEDILHISFSTALSGSTENVMRVAEELNKTSKNKIYVINSLNAAAGEGLLVLHAHDLINQGKKIEEIVEEIKNLIPKAKSYFTVQDLKYLVRGGRVSKFSGFLGNMLNIKPVLKVDEEGRLVPFKKVMGRKLAIRALLNIAKEQIGDGKYVIINHAVCLQDAEKLAEELKQELNITPIITDLTQVIGCHTGPGLLGVFFMGK